jgi:hypothetical protein
MKLHHSSIASGETITYVIYNVGSIGLSTRCGRKPCTLLWAARHNLRKIAVDLTFNSAIDSSRSNLNVVLAGPTSPEEVAALAKHQIDACCKHKRKLRRDHVQAVEILISLSKDLEGGSVSFFQACLEWIQKRFGPVAVLSAIVHYDETKPHMHVLISPIIDGRVNGSRLINRQSLIDQKNEFSKDVAEKFNVQLPRAKLTKVEQRQATNCVITHLNSVQSPLLLDPAWNSIKAAIQKDPIAFLADYEIYAELKKPKKSMRTSTEIFISKGKGSNYEL